MEQMLHGFLPALEPNTDSEPTREELLASAGRLSQKAIEVQAIMDMAGWKHIETILENAYEKNRELALEAEDMSDKDRERCRQYALSARDIKNHIKDIVERGKQARKFLDELEENI